MQFPESQGDTGFGLDGAPSSTRPLLDTHRAADNSTLPALRLPPRELRGPGAPSPARGFRSDPPNGSQEVHRPAGASHPRPQPRVSALARPPHPRGPQCPDFFPGSQGSLLTTADASEKLCEAEQQTGAHSFPLWRQLRLTHEPEVAEDGSEGQDRTLGEGEEGGAAVQGAPEPSRWMSEAWAGQGLRGNHLREGCFLEKNLTACQGQYLDIWSADISQNVAACHRTNLAAIMRDHLLDGNRKALGTLLEAFGDGVDKDDVLDVSGRHAVNTRQHLEVALRYWLDNLLRAERGKGKRISERVLSFLQTVKVMQCTKLWDRQRLQIEISIYHIRKGDLDTAYEVLGKLEKVTYGSMIAQSYPGYQFSKVLYRGNIRYVQWLAAMEKEMNTRKAAKESVLLEVPCTAGNGRVRCNDSESSDGEELGTGRGLQGSFERRWCVDDKLWSNLGQDTLNLWESACGHLKGALDSNPSSMGLTYQLIHLYVTAGEPEMAYEVARRCLEAAPLNLDANAAICMLLRAFPGIAQRSRESRDRVKQEERDGVEAIIQREGTGAAGEAMPEEEQQRLGAAEARNLEAHARQASDLEALKREEPVDGIVRRVENEQKEHEKQGAHLRCLAVAHLRLLRLCPENPEAFDGLWQLHHHLTPSEALEAALLPADMLCVTETSMATAEVCAIWERLVSVLETLDADHLESDELKAARVLLEDRRKWWGRCMFTEAPAMPKEESTGQGTRLMVAKAFCAAYVLLPEHPWFQAAKSLMAGHNEGASGTAYPVGGVADLELAELAARKLLLPGHESSGAKRPKPPGDGSPRAARKESFWSSEQPQTAKRRRAEEEEEDSESELSEPLQSSPTRSATGVATNSGNVSPAPPPSRLQVRGSGNSRFLKVLRAQPLCRENRRQWSPETSMSGDSDSEGWESSSSSGQ